MLIPFMMASLTALPVMQPNTTATIESTTIALDHGKLAWFDGTFEEATAHAAASKKILFLDFWTEW